MTGWIRVGKRHATSLADRAAERARHRLCGKQACVRHTARKDQRAGLVSGFQRLQRQRRGERVGRCVIRCIRRRRAPDLDRVAAGDERAAADTRAHEPFSRQFAISGDDCVAIHAEQLSHLARTG